MSDQPTLQQCAGVGLEGQAWFNVWNNDACYNVLYEQVFTTSTGGVGFNPEGYLIAQDTMDSVFAKYLMTNKITSPGLEGYNVFQDTIQSTCTRLPGICDPSLEIYCHNCPDCGSRSDIAADPPTLAFCGCYAPPPTVDPTILPQCDPLCTRIGTIPLPNGKGEALQCNNSVCVIDDVSIQAAKSSIGSDSINFRQVCNTCGSGPCTCIISGISITATLASIGVTSNFDQVCGPNSTCLETQPDGTDRVVDCAEAGPTPPKEAISANLWIVIVGVAFIVVLAVIIFIFKRK